MGKSLYDKVFDLHTVRRLNDGEYQLLIGLHLLHEVTSPQAFAELRARKQRVLFPKRNVATVDHIIPTRGRLNVYADAESTSLHAALERNAAEFGLPFLPPGSGEQGITHVIAPELGLSQPGMTIVCGDSHTSTHGAFGALAFGIGTSQVRDVLGTQTLVTERLRVRRIQVDGELSPGVTAKDIILHVIHRLGTRGGVSLAYEYAGSTIEALSLDERMTLCNMSIEGGARCGYVNPDEKVYHFLRGRRFAPQAASWERACTFWQSICSDPDAEYADVVRFEAAEIEPMVTWGITPAQAVPVGARLPDVTHAPAEHRPLLEEAYRFMSFEPGQTLLGTPIDVAFVGSCANGRVSDFEAVADLLRRTGGRVAPHVRALLVPGSERVREELDRKGYTSMFERAGFEVGKPGCSLCCGFNGDPLRGRQICASSSTRNFKGRQGSATGRTLLMSPIMVAAAAIRGAVVDVRELLGDEREVAS